MSFNKKYRVGVPNGHRPKSAYRLLERRQAAERGYYAGVGKVDLPLIDGEVQSNG